MRDFVYYYEWVEQKFYILLLERQTVYTFPFPASSMAEFVHNQGEPISFRKFQFTGIAEKLGKKGWPVYAHPEIEKNLADCRILWKFDLDTSCRVAKYNLRRLIELKSGIRKYIEDPEADQFFMHRNSLGILPVRLESDSAIAMRMALLARKDFKLTLPPVKHGPPLYITAIDPYDSSYRSLKWELKPVAHKIRDWFIEHLKKHRP